MDNLTAIVKHDILITLFISIVFCIMFIVEYTKIRRDGEKKKKCELLFMIVLFAGIAIYTIYSYRPAYLDTKIMDIQNCNGIVQEEVSVKRAKRTIMNRYDILTDKGEIVSVYVSVEKVDEYLLEKGKEYTIEYFPRTKAVYSITPLK